MLLLVLSFLLILSCLNIISSAPLISPIQEITTAFIKNLNARDLGYYRGFENAKLEHSIEEKDRNSFADFPHEILSHIFEFMSYNDSKKFRELSKACDISMKQWVSQRLLRFSQHFFFEDDRINQLLAFEFSYFFKPLTKIHDADACDQYELACVERRHELSDVSSPKLRYLIQSFIHESFYGSDSPIPTSEFQWKILIYLKNHDKANEARKYDKSFERISQINREIIDAEFNDFVDREKLNRYFDKFDEIMKSKCSYLDKYFSYSCYKERAGLEPRLLRVSFEKEIDIVISVLFHRFRFPDLNIYSVLENVIKNGLYSQSLFARALPTVEPFYYDILKDPECATNRMVIKHFHDLFTKKDSDVHYLFTRVPSRSNFQGDAIRIHYFLQMVSVKSPSLIYFDAILKFVLWHISRSSAILNSIQDKASSFAYLAYNWGHVSIFDLVFTLYGDNNKKINVFYRDSRTYKMVNIFNSNPHELNEEKMIIYLKYLLKTADPLPLIFIRPEFLFGFANLITEKFILNKRYSIDFFAEDFDFSSHLNRLSSRRRQVLSFEEIIHEMHVPDLMELFSSRPFPEPNNSDHVISIAKFIQSGLLD